MYEQFLYYTIKPCFTLNINLHNSIETNFRNQNQDQDNCTLFLLFHTQNAVFDLTTSINFIISTFFFFFTKRK